MAITMVARRRADRPTSTSARSRSRHVQYNKTKYHRPLVAERSAQPTHEYRRAGNRIRARGGRQNFCTAQELPETIAVECGSLADVGFSNRPVGVKRFQAIHHCSVDVERRERRQV
jgi:hypothetical protein